MGVHYPTSLYPLFFVVFVDLRVLLQLMEYIVIVNMLLTSLTQTCTYILGEICLAAHYNNNY